MSIYKNALEVYTLEEILEYNDISPEDALEFLVDERFITLPEIEPLEFD